MTASRDLRRVVFIATATSVAMIAFQMGAKATRDALFLSSYDVESLPLMAMASAAVSLLVALAAARKLTALGPGRYVPALFFASAVLLALEWQFVGAARGPVAVIVYLHYGALGALVVSGFWSLVNELFDPRTARRQIGRIASGGTVGGLLGGVLAERSAVWFSVESMLPVLAGLHVLCAWLAWWMAGAGGRSAPAARRGSAPGEKSESGMTIIRRSTYLTTLLTLVFVLTVTEGLVDWVFKARATDVFGRGEDLLRLFAVFYTAVGLITVGVQAVVSRLALRRLGLARTIAALPGAVAAGSVGALAFPGLVSAAVLRGAESMLRHGLYRPAYELLFTPLPPGRKRPTKALMDVGVVRLGDIGGAAVVQLVLVVAAGAAAGTLLGLSVLLALLGIVLAVRLHRGYVRSLERSLVAQGRDAPDESEAVTRTALFQSTAFLHLTAPALTLPDDDGDAGDGGDEAYRESAAAATALVAGPIEDAAIRQIVDLRSGDERRVRRVLTAGTLRPELVPFAIRLLGWDPAMRDAISALRRVADRETGQLVDHLLDRDEAFAVRRRIPLVLIAAPTARAFDGLFQGLDDRRFEVRYRCGRALVRLRERNADLQVERDRVADAIVREVAVDRGVWESHALLDKLDEGDEGWSPAAGALLRDRADRSLEHVFTLLALILPKEPLAVAFRALHTTDRQLKGTALEYLDTALPSRVREQLWPFLEDEGKSEPRASGAEAESALKALMRSSDSITINLERLQDETPGPDALD